VEGADEVAIQPPRAPIASVERQSLSGTGWALEVFERIQPEGIVLDVMLPDRPHWDAFIG
jgi:hypothetical protein